MERIKIWLIFISVSVEGNKLTSVVVREKIMKGYLALSEFTMCFDKRKEHINFKYISNLRNKSVMLQLQLA